MSYTPNQSSPIFAFYNGADQTLVPPSPAWPPTTNVAYEVDVNLELNSNLGTGSSVNDTTFNVHGDAHVISDIRTCFNSTLTTYELIMSSRIMSNSTELGYRGQDRGENNQSPVNYYDIRARTDDFAKAKVDAFQPFSTNAFNLVTGSNRNQNLITIPKECALVGILT